MVAARSAGARRKKSAVSYKDTLGGFTIIEVVLVLAIAGLIFLMVFIALPQLQRAQRDTQRTEDITRLAAAVVQYKSNHNGKLPEEGTCSSATSGEGSGGTGANKTICKLIQDYLVGTDNDNEEAFADPLEGAYEVTVKKFDGKEEELDNDDAELGQIFMYTGAVCNADNTALQSAASRDYAFVYRKESGGVVCQSGSR